MSPAPRAPAASQYAATGDAGSRSSSRAIRSRSRPKMLVARGAARHLRLAIDRAGPPLEQALAAAGPRRRPGGGLIDDAREELGRRAEGSLEKERLGEADDQLVPLPGGEGGRLDRHQRRPAADEVVLRALPAEPLEPCPSHDEFRGVDELGLRDLSAAAIAPA